MALEPFAAATDVAAVFRPLTSAEASLADALLIQVSNKLRRQAVRRGVDIDLLMADELTADAVKTAVVNAVKRVLMNPEAIRQMSETTGPMTESRTLDTSISSGLLFLDPSDLLDIFPASKASGIRSFRVRAGLS